MTPCAHHCGVDPSIIACCLVVVVVSQRGHHMGQSAQVPQPIPTPCDALVHAAQCNLPRHVLLDHVLHCVLELWPSLLACFWALPSRLLNVRTPSLSHHQHQHRHRLSTFIYPYLLRLLDLVHI